MEDNSQRRKRDLRDVSHYFFSSQEELKTPDSERVPKVNQENIDKEETPRSIIDEIKSAIGTGYPNMNEYEVDESADEKVSASPYQTIGSETSAFLKPIESTDEKNETSRIDENTRSSFAGFTPLLKTVSLLPVIQESYSLLLNVYFAKLLLHTPYKVYIISTNPHNDSWNYLERNLDLPSIVDVDLSKGLRTFSIFDSVDLLILKPEHIDNLFNLNNLEETNPQLFDSQGKQLLFLIDYGTVDIAMKEKLTSMIDCFVILTSAQNESLRNAYKTIKGYASIAPHAQFKCILNAKDDFYLEEFLQREFNNIISQFLHRTVDFIGFCDSDIFVHGNNLKWKTKEKEHAFNINTEFLTSLKKENWSENLLNFYQTVISNVKF